MIVYKLEATVAFCNAFADEGEGEGEGEAEGDEGQEEADFEAEGSVSKRSSRKKGIVLITST